MEVLTKLRKVGGSVMARIPKEVLEHESLHPGETVKIEVKKVKISGFGIFKGMRSFTKKDEFKGQLEE
ncbi:AbrB/MazE/SpoVT family DNA-binding domain-containing protein [Candidatus Woesearchaeota archaeon]|nr:AbrB/MazE/SpoVT family DNA-binding domain-containing protein [Candidatus Woesearchaeota archaeon]